jgi:hypothetical protein
MITVGFSTRKDNQEFISYLKLTMVKNHYQKRTTKLLMSQPTILLFFVTMIYFLRIKIGQKIY